MPNIDKLLKQSDAGFKRYTGIHKATFYGNRRQRYDLRMKLFAGIINFELKLWLLQEV